MTLSTAQLLEDTRQIGMHFLMVDIATALTFLQVAEVTTVEETRTRNRLNARKAYDTVLRLLPRLVVYSDERTQLEENLQLLRKRLISAGSLVDS